jgi:pentatricopeptide repeat protein
MWGQPPVGCKTQVLLLGPLLSACFVSVLLPAASYNALLEICYKSNDSDRALDVIDRMANDEVEPDDQTWELAARKRTWRSYMRKVMG